MKAIIDSIRDMVLTCPFLADERVNVDYIGVKMSYSINPIPCDPIIRKYVDGGAIKQFQFAFLSKEEYDDDAMLCIENSGFIQNFEEWLEKNVPDLDGNKNSVACSVLSRGYLFDTDGNKAQYRVECRLEYEEW